jgi:hypothetical protein
MKDVDKRGPTNNYTYQELRDLARQFKELQYMENTFKVSLRLSSKNHDFKELIPEIIDCKVIYKKKGENLNNSSSSFKAQTNILFINNCIVNNIDNITNTIIVTKLAPFMKKLSVINIDDMEREVYIAGSIENDQFGFSIGLDFINLLLEYKYSLSFSGISYL